MVRVFEKKKQLAIAQRVCEIKFLHKKKKKPDEGFSKIQLLTNDSVKACEINKYLKERNLLFPL